MVDNENARRLSLMPLARDLSICLCRPPCNSAMPSLIGQMMRDVVLGVCSGDVTARGNSSVNRGTCQLECRPERLIDTHCAGFDSLCIRSAVVQFVE